MKVCSKCGNYNDNSASSCLKCKNSLEFERDFVACTHCGKLNLSSEYVCSDCKNALKNSETGIKDPKLKSMYDLLLAQKNSLITKNPQALETDKKNSFVNHASTVIIYNNGEQKGIDQNVGSDKPINLVNVKKKGSALRMILFIILSLGVLSSFYFSYALSNLKGFASILAIPFVDTFLNFTKINLAVINEASVAMDALVNANLTGLKNVVLNIVSYGSLCLIVFALINFILILFSYKYSGFVKKVVSFFSLISIVIAVLVTGGFWFVEGYKNALPIGMFIGVGANLVLLIAMNVCFNKKKEAKEID